MYILIERKHATKVRYDERRRATDAKTDHLSS
jgi:hypothetical protein